MTGILAFFRMIGWRNLLLIFLAIAVFILVKRQFFPDNPAKPRVVSLFDRVEYVRELRLVTHYGEDVLEIGVQDALDRKREKQEEQLEDARLTVQQARQKLALSNEYAQNSIDRALRLDQQLRDLQRSKDALTADYERRNPGVIITMGKIGDILQQDRNAFGAEVAQKYGLWRNLSNERPEKRMLEKEIRELVKNTRDDRMATYDAERESLELDIAQTQEALKAARKEQRDAERLALRANQDLIDQQRSFIQDSILLEQIKVELENAETSPLPKLLAMVTTEVTAFVDLAGITSDLDGSKLTLCGVPAAQLDTNVRITLSAENRFLTADKLMKLVNGDDDDADEYGIYYQVYEELREALRELESQVLEEAIDNGILEEANNMAADYLRQMGRSLGFGEIVILASCEKGSAEVNEQPTLSLPDSLLAPSESEIRRRNDSLQAIMEEEGTAEAMPHDTAAPAAEPVTRPGR